ncbi:uncharacterized protein LY79DRAFT_239407 [Colletotrichum navitas]|uniref:Uncharacterized protein n=1 Tax=Colletotrichum navitas TaxID=681940 RepID=A0AAD8PY73_9PEZI|nr:uncharacterized protein LY79DRAFT_239407 [Colletotrichum navitas]KAK1589734.1 hypothetical protein LY79DRAFT_239407 [Colletotrichum navitas]
MIFKLESYALPDVEGALHARPLGIIIGSRNSKVRLGVYVFVCVCVRARALLGFRPRKRPESGPLLALPCGAFFHHLSLSLSLSAASEGGGGDRRMAVGHSGIPTVFLPGGGGRGPTHVRVLVLRVLGRSPPITVPGAEIRPPTEFGTALVARGESKTGAEKLSPVPLPSHPYRRRGGVVADCSLHSICLPIRNLGSLEAHPRSKIGACIFPGLRTDANDAVRTQSHSGSENQRAKLT